MAGDLKAVVEITADTSGLIKGMDGAVKKISEGTSAVSEMAKFDTLKKSMEMLSSAFEMIGKRNRELYDNAVGFSPFAAAADMNSQVAKMNSVMGIANATAPGAIAMANMDAQSAAAKLARVQRNAEDINAGMASQHAVETNYGTQKDILMDSLSNVMGGDFRKAFGGLGELFNSQNYVYTDQSTPGRGMNGWDTSNKAEELLSQILTALKGK